MKFILGLLPILLKFNTYMYMYVTTIHETHKFARELGYSIWDSPERVKGRGKLYNSIVISK